MRSPGRSPITPLITDTCSVVSLSARTSDGRLRPVRRHSGWVPSTEMECVEDEEPDEVVMKARMKSSGESHRASPKQGRRFALVRSVNGNAAWTISPGWNMPRLLPEPWIFPTGQNIGVAVNLRLLFQNIEGAALFSQGGNHRAAHFLRLRFSRLQNQDREPSLRWKMDTRWEFQHPIVFDFDLQRFHGRNERLRAFFAAAVVRRIVVSLEIWDDWSVTRGPGGAYDPGAGAGWNAHPFNPRNNISRFQHEAVGRLGQFIAQVPFWRMHPAPDLVKELPDRNLGWAAILDLGDRGRHLLTHGVRTFAAEDRRVRMPTQSMEQMPISRPSGTGPGP
jgi:hypothetical protein